MIEPRIFAAFFLLLSLVLAMISLFILEYHPRFRSLRHFERRCGYCNTICLSTILSIRDYSELGIPANPNNFAVSVHITDPKIKEAFEYSWLCQDCYNNVPEIRQIRALKEL